MYTQKCEKYGDVLSSINGPYIVCQGIGFNDKKKNTPPTPKISRKTSKFFITLVNR